MIVTTADQAINCDQGLHMHHQVAASALLYGSLAVLPSYAVDRSWSRIRNQSDRHATSRWLAYGGHPLTRCSGDPAAHRPSVERDDGDFHAVDFFV